MIANVDPLGNRTSFGYDAASRPVTTTNALGFVSSTVFDAANRPVASIDPLGNTSTTVFDANSRPVARINPLGNAFTSVFDAADRLIATRGSARQSHELRVSTQRAARFRSRTPWECLDDGLTMPMAEPWPASTPTDSPRPRSMTRSANGWRSSMRGAIERASRGTPTEGKPAPAMRWAT